jgi:Tfp pilus assembly protein PilF
MNKTLASIVSLAAVLLLSGCGSTIFQAETADSSSAGDGQASQARIAPYLQNRPAVSREVRQRFELANVYMAGQDWPGAVAELQWLVQTQQDLSGPCLNLALVYQNLDKLENAEELYRLALQRNPDNLVAYNQYAIFLRQQGRFEEAEATYLQALESWEFDSQTHRNIGVLYDMYMGDQVRALQHFHRYQSLTGTEDRAVASWIADLNRQLMTLAQREETP